MKKLLMLIITLFMFIPLVCEVNAKELIDVHIFYSKTCGHCKKAKEFLKEYQENEGKIEIHYYEVTYNKQNALKFEEVQNVLDHPSMSVPYIVIGTEVFVGYSDNLPNEIKNTVLYYEENDYIDVTSKIIDREITKENISEYLKKEDIISDTVKIPLLGEVNVKKVSIPILAIVMGLVDGFNPCAMWVLIFLISMLINMKDRKKMWILGLSFLLTSALVYGLIMGAWLNIVVNFAGIRWIQIIIGIIALIGSIFNFRSYYLERKKDSGCQIVDEKKRKNIISKIKKFTSEKNFILALLGIILLAISVNVVELACSAGLPVLFTNILAVNNITGISALLYILLYILFFLLDDLIIFFVAVVTFKVTGMTTKYTKFSHLIGAIIMLIIGILMIVKPEWIMFNF